MNESLGISFSPFSGNGADNQQSRSGSAVTPQEAIRTLSLRVPRAVGAGAPAPSALLNGAGGRGFGGGGMDLEQLLAMLFGQQQGRVGTQPMAARDVYTPDQPFRFNVPGLQAPAASAAPFEPPKTSAPTPNVGFGQTTGSGAALPPTGPMDSRLGAMAPDRRR